jgi:hypothetical protein
VTYAGSRRLPYSLELARKPLAWATVVAAGVLTVVAATTSMAIPIVMVLVLAMLGWLIATRPSVRRRLDAEWREREARRQRDERETRLEQANIRRDGLASLTELTDEITRWDPSRAERLELEALLDQYAEIAIISEQWRNVVASEDLCRQLHARPRVGTLHHEMVDRRLAHAQLCLDRWSELQDQLAVINEMVAIYTIRAAIDGKRGS